MKPNDIKWMQPRTKRILDKYLPGIDIVDANYNSDYLNFFDVRYNGKEITIWTGPMDCLSNDEIDRRFCAAFLQFVNKYTDECPSDFNLYAVSDLLLKNYAAA